MKGKGKFLVFLFIVMMSLALVGPVNAADKVIEWKMAGVYGPGDGGYLPERAAKEITEQSGGRLKVTTYPGGQLFKTKEIFGAIQKGLIQMCDIPSGYWGGGIPLYKLPDTPFLLKDNTEWRAWLEGGLWPLWQKASENVGIKCIGMTGWNGTTAFSRYPIKNLADVKGKKWRVYTPTMQKACIALGASPVFIAFPEVYSALQKGVIDAAYGGVTWAAAYKWEEVGRHVVKVDFGLPPTGLFVNKKAFDALPPDLQEIVVKAGKKYMDSWDIVEGFTAKKWKQFKDEGCDVYILPDAERNKWMDLCKNIWTEQAKEIGPVGEEALEIYYKVFPDRRPK